MAALYPVVTAGLDHTGVDRRRFTTTSSDGAEVELWWFTPGGEPGGASATAAGPAVVHAHGGGMIAGEVALFAPYVAEQVAGSGVPFLSVDYRRAPEAGVRCPGMTCTPA